MNILKTIQENPGKSLLVAIAIAVIIYLIVKAMKKNDTDDNVISDPSKPNPNVAPTSTDTY